MSKEKSRYFIFLLYPDSMPVDWQLKLESIGLPMAISPLHNRDVSERKYEEMSIDEQKIIDSGGIVYKKPHYHVIYVAKNPVTCDSVRVRIRRALGEKSVALVKIPINIVDYYLYLTHDSKDAISKRKHKYGKSDILLINNFDIDRYCTLSLEDKKEKFHTSIALIREYTCANIIELAKIVQEEESCGLTIRELEELTTQYSSAMRLWFDGNYQKDNSIKPSKKTKILIDEETGEVLDS